MAKKIDPETHWVRGTRLVCPIAKCNEGFTVAIPIAKGSAAFGANHPKVQTLISSEEKAERARQAAEAEAKGVPLHH